MISSLEGLKAARSGKEREEKEGGGDVGGDTLADGCLAVTAFVSGGSKLRSASVL